MQTLPGIDVSNYQGTIDWKKVRKSGRVFAAAKATEGLAFRDATFPHNWLGMRGAGLIRGAYHFLHPSLSGATQAHYLHMAVRDAGGFRPGDYVLLDLEESDGQPGYIVMREAVAFVLASLGETGRQVVVYTGKWFFESLSIWPPAELTRQPLWVAAYGMQSPPPIPPWELISFWQWTDQGRVPGIEGTCDLDTFFGTMDQLHAVLAPPGEHRP